MLNAPLDPAIEATSWRLSLRALLVRASVVEQLGGLDHSFSTVPGAALEMGMRWTKAGALVRHVPQLAPAGASEDQPPTSSDGLTLIARHDGRMWAGWALQRSVLTRDITLGAAVRLAPRLRGERRRPLPHFDAGPQRPGAPDRTVSVIVPTVDRYPYLEVLLHQLAAQRTAPHEVVVADQTPLERRRTGLELIEPALPLTVLSMPEPGQSTSRNAAIRHATGELLLFLDDDDEIGPDLLTDHLRLLTDGIDATSGAVDDATAGPPPPGFRHRRASTTFPTNHTLVRRAALLSSGLFDPVFDRGPRADHDLGMRLQLAGAMLVYDPSVMVYHHHAPAGGLRTHNARSVTRASARRSLTERNLPSVTELYIAHRYYTGRQRRAARAVRLLSFLSCEGGLPRRVVRALVQLALLPASKRTYDERAAAAARIHASRPSIPTLAPEVDQ
jgi:GT2 family glycosyltransferase